MGEINKKNNIEVGKYEQDNIFQLWKEIQLKGRIRLMNYSSVSCL
jgi:hypothetical protein